MAEVLLASYHTIMSHFMNQINNAPLNFLTTFAVFIVHILFLFPLKFSKGCDRIALNIHLVIGQDVGHDATSSCESYGLEPLEVVQEILVGVGEIVIKIGSES